MGAAWAGLRAIREARAAEVFWDIPKFRIGRSEGGFREVRMSQGGVNCIRGCQG